MLFHLTTIFVRPIKRRTIFSQFDEYFTGNRAVLRIAIAVPRRRKIRERGKRLEKINVAPVPGDNRDSLYVTNTLCLLV